MLLFASTGLEAGLKGKLNFIRRLLDRRNSLKHTNRDFGERARNYIFLL
jgi:hypothetical protein